MRQDQVLLTRFNLPSAGYESLVRSKSGWLENRVQLFERYCLPSVRAQTQTDFSWLVYFDPQSPAWLRRKIEEWEGSSRLRACFRSAVSSDQLLEDIGRVSGSRGERLLTTNLDNDDALSVDFIARVRNVDPDSAATVIYVPSGLIARGEALYRRTDRSNAFCTVSAPWERPQTCWADWHNRLALTMPARLERGGPGWLQVVHGGNVSNRVHGVLASPAAYASSFPGLLDGLREPSVAHSLLDRSLGQPSRVLREFGRRIAKEAIVAAGGRSALDRVRTRVHGGATLGKIPGRGKNT
jgi:hypothetical protein